MGRTLETAAVETKSSLPLLTRYRPLRFTSPVQPDVWTVSLLLRGATRSLLSALRRDRDRHQAGAELRVGDNVDGPGRSTAPVCTDRRRRHG
jgi:hypothetical protein